MTDNYKTLRDLILKSEGKTLEDELGFGQIVLIEQKRFKTKNELYYHKVIGALESNTFVDVPTQGFVKEQIHSEMAPCVKAITCGLDERTALKYRIEDVEILGLPITLERVLRALGKNLKFDVTYNVCTPKKGAVMCIYDVNTSNEILVWNLEENQTDETILKLIELLK